MNCAEFVKTELCPFDRVTRLDELLKKTPLLREFSGSLLIKVEKPGPECTKWLSRIANRHAIVSKSVSSL